jgi:hypothetical protein
LQKTCSHWPNEVTFKPACQGTMLTSCAPAPQIRRNTAAATLSRQVQRRSHQMARNATTPRAAAAQKKPDDIEPSPTTPTATPVHQRALSGAAGSASQRKPRAAHARK